MIVLRGIFAVIFALLGWMFLSDVLNKTPEPDYRDSLPVLVIFGGIILVLGPLWPSAGKIEKVKAFLDRVTGLPNATPIVANVICVCFAAFKVWDTYYHPPKEFSGFERAIARIFGPDNVPLAWLFLAVGAALYAARLHKRSKGMRS